MSAGTIAAITQVMQVRRFVRELAKACWNDQLGDVAAMMAYYAIMALFPMIVFVVSLALLVLPATTVQQGVAMASEAAPPAVRGMLAERVGSLIEANNAGFAIGAFVFALWGASRGAVGLGTALGAIYTKPETRSWLRRQLTAFAMTIAVAVLVVLALGLLVLGPLAGHMLGLGGAFDVAWSFARWIGAGLLVMIVWAMSYKFLPDTDAPFRVFTPGAIVGVLLWLGMSALFGIYLAHFGRFEATYGALGTVIIFLVWLWLSNIALLVGAEINDVLADVRAPYSAAAARLADTHEHAHAAS
jgi:membrane protein